MKTNIISLIAFYLPQYHPIPENDLAWGEGFTEWTNVKKAVPLFQGHIQPKTPTTLGYYNLLSSDIQEKQSEIALQFGISCFAYWYYWMGNGKRLLEQPLNNMINNKNIKIPFCLSWANESWSGIWHGNPNKCIVSQDYPGEADILEHAKVLAYYFNDNRYFKVDGRPLFLIYKPFKLPSKYIKQLRLALLDYNINPFIVAISQVLFDYKKSGFDGLNLNMLGQYRLNKHINFAERAKWAIKRKFFPNDAVKKICYTKYVQNLSKFHKLNHPSNIFPTCIPNWDNSPRSGRSALVLTDSTPMQYSLHLNDCIKFSHRINPNPLVFIKSWNEWAEGNYLEPDSLFDTQYLQATLRIVRDFQ